MGKATIVLLSETPLTEEEKQEQIKRERRDFCWGSALLLGYLACCFLALVFFDLAGFFAVIFLALFIVVIMALFG